MYASSSAVQHAAYRQQAVETANPAQLVLMLYDGALAALTRTEQAAALPPGSERTRAMHEHLVKAQLLVTELRVTLDPERGGVIAANLAALYEFCLQRLVAANLSKDVATLEAVRSTLAGLRDAWYEACCQTAAAV